MIGGEVLEMCEGQAVPPRHISDHHILYIGTHVIAHGAPGTPA
jgi:hypothetical protein